MLIFDDAKRSVASCLIKVHQASGVESYWAVDAQGATYWNSGDATGVRALPDLEARYDDPSAEVVYHHSHPDERALSSSDLQLIGWSGVQQIWAHTPEHSAYGAELKPEISKEAYLQEFRKLQGCVLPSLVEYQDGTALSSAQFGSLYDLAIMTAMESKGWISVYIQMSDVIRREVFGSIFGYVQLEKFFHDNLSTP